MKTTKILMTTLAVATLAAGCGVLAACADKDEEPVTYSVTFDANGGTYADSKTTVQVKTDANGRIAQKPTDPTREGLYTFTGYNTVQEGTGTAITFGANGYQFKADATVYAQWNLEYTLTLNAGEHGKFGEETTKQVTTVNKKLPANVGLTPDTGWKLTGWLNEDEEPVTADTVFTEDTTLTAQWSAIDGIYKKDGTLLAELQETDKDTYLKQLAGVVSLNVGDEIVFKIDGVILSHTQHTAELWSADCFGVTFDQTEGSFTAVESLIGTEGARPFNVYAKYWTNANQDFGWTITMDDGERSPVVENGAYLVGAKLTAKFTDGDHYEKEAWKIVKEFYIDPEVGLTVTIADDSEFKVAQCKNGSVYWDSNPKYAMANGLDADCYLTFPGSDNGTALAPGDYTITVDEDTWTFTFTPGANVTPVEPAQRFIHYYIKGSFEGWSASKNENTELTADPENENVYTSKGIKLAAGVEFMFYSDAEDANGKVLQGEVDYFNNGNTTLVDAEIEEDTKYLEVTLEGEEEPVRIIEMGKDANNYKTKQAGTYTFTLNAQTKQLTITFVADAPTEGEVDE